MAAIHGTQIANSMKAMQHDCTEMLSCHVAAQHRHLSSWLWQSCASPVSVLAAAPELTLACLGYLPVSPLHSSPEALPGFSHCPILPAAGNRNCETGTTMSTAAGVGLPAAAAGHSPPQHIHPPPAHEQLLLTPTAGAGSTRSLLVSPMQELYIAGAGRGRPCC